MKISDIFSRVMSQITSGRWIFTVVASYCLIALTRTLCWLMEQGKITLETSTYVAIVMSILQVVSTIAIFYFNKQRPDIIPDSSSDSVVEVTTTTTTLGNN